MQMGTENKEKAKEYFLTSCLCFSMWSLLAYMRVCFYLNLFRYFLKVNPVCKEGIWNGIFFCPRDKKHANGSRRNRRTDIGYWKTTGKDRFVCHNSHTIGVKKILFFHVGRAPCRERTNWAMYEYKLEDRRLANLGISQDAYVLCRLFTKSGPGPKNGEQYGAPLKEDEWEDGIENISSLFVPLSSPGPPLDLLLLDSVPQPVLPGDENLANHPLDSLDTEKMLLPHFSDNVDVVSKLLGHTSWELPASPLSYSEDLPFRRNCIILVASASPCSLRLSVSCNRSFWDLRMNHTWRCGMWSFQLKVVVPVFLMSRLLSLWLMTLVLTNGMQQATKKCACK